MKTDTTECQQLKSGRIHCRQIDDTSLEVLRLNVDRNLQGKRKSSWIRFDARNYFAFYIGKEFFYYEAQ